MKTIMKSTTIYKALLAFAAPLMLAACSSDEANEPKPIPAEEQFQGFVFNIPNPQVKTRADGEELRVNTMDILIYKQESGEDNTPTVHSVTNKDLSFTDYTQVRVPIADGTYHIYVIANVNFGNVVFSQSYDGWDKVPESKLADAYISNMKPMELIGSPAANQPTAVKSLPMTCNYLAIKYYDTTAQAIQKVGSDGNIVIGDKKTTHVYCDLTYAVAKVRYTVLNGKVKGLKLDSSNPVYIENYAQNVSLMDHLASTSSSVGDLADKQAINLNCKSYACPDYNPTNGKILVQDPDDSSKKIETEAIPTLTTAVSGTPDEIAYQGVVYVPERLFTSNEASASDFVSTKIHFNFNQTAYSEKAHYALGGPVTITDDMDGSSTASQNGVIRGVFYDILAYTNAKTVDFKVRVKAWEYHKSSQDLEEE